MWCCYKLTEIPIPIPKPKPKIVPILRQSTYFATHEIKTRSNRYCNNSTHVY